MLLRGLWRGVDWMCDGTGGQMAGIFGYGAIIFGWL